MRPHLLVSAPPTLFKTIPPSMLSSRVPFGKIRFLQPPCQMTYSSTFDMSSWVKEVAQCFYTRVLQESVRASKLSPCQKLCRYCCTYFRQEHQYRSITYRQERSAHPWKSYKHDSNFGWVQCILYRVQQTRMKVRARFIHRGQGAE